MSVIQGNAIESGLAAYEIPNSLKFNSADSAYLNRTFGTPTSNTTWTFSCWLKRGDISVSGRGIFSESTGYAGIYFTNGDILRVMDNAGGVAIQTTAVYRDPSAWAHLVVRSNGTNIKAYWNSVEVGSYNGTITLLNAATSHHLGRYSSSYFNGYMTEVNFIDGQALDPTSFGEYNSETGVWQPIAYAGTYGTNGFYLPMTQGDGWSGYFDGSNDYLQVADNDGFDYGTGDFTQECWINGSSSSSFSNQYLLGRYDNTGSSHSMLQISSSTQLYWYYGNGSSFGFTLGTALQPNTWYHLAVSRASGSLRVFVNGTQVGSTQSDSANYGGTGVFRISNGHTGSATYFPGYITNVRVVKGTGLYTANFTPSTTPLTAVSGTTLLTCNASTFVDSSGNGLTITNNGGVLAQRNSPFYLDATDDNSGNSNNWQPNNLNLTSSAPDGDIMVDVPTNYGTDTGVGAEVRGNYCTWNSAAPYTGSFTSNGNLNFVNNSGTHRSAIGTIGVSSGKWYWEMSNVTNGNIGISSNASSTASYVGQSSVAYGMAYNGVFYNNASDIGGGFSFTNANVIGVALDMDAGTLVMYKDGVSQGTLVSGLTGTWFPATGRDGQTSSSANFGQRPFAYTAPSGFKALCTTNLPDPAIADGSQYFDATLWTGNGTSQNIVNSGGFQPDLVWNKSRSTTYSNEVTDSVRGITHQLYTNLTDSEYTASNQITSFNSNGFSIGAGNNINASGQTYVGWQWKAGGTGVTNTAGSITSTVSANTTAGFSVLTYTGNGTAGATVGHGLSVAPSFLVVKNRDTAGEQWVVYHKTLGGTQYLKLSDTSAVGASVIVWNNTDPTSSVITLGNWSAVNQSTKSHVCYAFAPVEGYSAFGSYTGNGSADGPFVYTGFRPAFVLWKRTDTSGNNWVIQDDMRSAPYNPANGEIMPSSSAAESTSFSKVDLLSNGFKIRSTNGGENASGGTYIYAAFAENAFKVSLGR